MIYRSFSDSYTRTLRLRSYPHEILEMPELIAVKERFHYTLRIGAMALLTGNIGNGKFTALRYAMGQLHSSEFATFYLTPSSGSILELFRQILTVSEFQMLGTLSPATRLAVCSVLGGTTD